MQADARTRKEIDLDALGGQIDRAFAPLLSRVPQTDFTPSTGHCSDPIVLEGQDLLQDSIRTNVRLAQELTAEVEKLERALVVAQKLRCSFHGLEQVWHETVASLSPIDCLLILSA